MTVGRSLKYTLTGSFETYSTEYVTRKKCIRRRAFMLLMPFLHLTPKTHLAGNDYREGVIAQNAQFGINRWDDDEHFVESILGQYLSFGRKFGAQEQYS